MSSDSFSYNTYALTSDGDVWRFNGTDAFTPIYMGNLRSGPVPVEGSTWGQVKSRFK